MTTPSQEIRTAADKLRSLITFLGDNRGPWKVGTPPSGYPQSISNVGVPYCVADTHEDPSIPVFTIAPYIATMHPGVGAALADWLETTAASLAASTHPDWQDCVAPDALAVARAILGGEQS